MVFSYLVQGLLLGLSAAASPGPFQAFLLAQTLRTGFRRTLPAAFAPLLTDGPIIAVIFLLLNRLPDAFLVGIRLAGALFLFYFAWGTFRSVRNLTGKAQPAISPVNSLSGAIVMNFLSPGPYIYWSLIAGPIVLQAWRITPHLAVMFFLGFYFAFLAGNTALIGVFTLAHRTGTAFRKGLLVFSSLALAGFGIYQIIQGIIALTAMD